MSDRRRARRRSAAVVVAALALSGTLLAQRSAHSKDDEKTPADQVSTPLVESVYRGRSCARVPRATSPDDPNPGDGWVATTDAVAVTCGSLGCVDDPRFEDGHFGICATPQSPGDCAGGGITIDPATRRCARPSKPLALETNTLRAVRFMLTTSAVVVSGLEGASGAHPNLLAGLYYEVALRPARVLKIPEGGYRYEDITRWYLHLGIAGTRALFTHDVGFVVRLPSDTFTRLGFTAYGVFIDQPTPTVSVSYRVGPEVNVEIMNNLVLKGAWLPAGTELGPRWMGGIEYMARLFDDVLPTSH